jgi:hypothetical protein
MPQNLLPGPDPVLLPDDNADARVRAALDAGRSSADAVRADPDSSLGWAMLAESALARAGGPGGSASDRDDDALVAYAFARTGYHRGLDALRRAGWRGQGPVPSDHVPNRGVLRAILALADAADLIDETAEGERCRQFLADSGTSADEVRALIS